MKKVVGLDVHADSMHAVLLTTSLRQTSVQSYARISESDEEEREAFETVEEGSGEEEVAPSDLAFIDEEITEVKRGNTVLPEAIAAFRAKRASKKAEEEVDKASSRKLPFGAVDTLLVRIPGQHAVLHQVEMPISASKHLEQVLPNELELLIPYEIEDVVIDYQPVDESSEKIRLLTAAILTTEVSEWLEKLRLRGISPHEIAVGAAALDGLVPVVPELQGEGPYAVLVAGSHQIELCIIRQGRCHFARTLAVAESADTWAESSLKSLRRTMLAYRAQGGSPVVQSFVAGSYDTDEEGLNVLSELLGCAVSLLPLPAAEDGSEPSPKFARALALAGRTIKRGKRINIRKGEFAPPKMRAAYGQHAKLFGVCGVVLFFACWFALYAKSSQLEQRSESLRAELRKATGEIFGESTDDVEKAEKLFSSVGRVSDPMPKITAYDLLSSVSEAIPHSIQHDIRELRIDLGLEGGRGRLELDGLLSNNQEKAQIRSALEKHKCVKEITEGATSPAGQGRLRYKLEAVLECADTKKTSKRKKRRRRS